MKTERNVVNPSDVLLYIYIILFMTCTTEEFQKLQNQIIQQRTENYSLKEQVETAKKRSSMTGAQYVESLKNDNLQIRVRINQLIKERDNILEKLKLIKIIQFLRLQNIYESTTVPDIQSIPVQVRGIASEVLSLIDDVKQQIARRAFLDTQVNELSKRTKSLGRAGEQLQTQITELREQQKTELYNIELKREELQGLENETTRLRESLYSFVASPGHNITSEDVKMMTRKVKNLSDQLESKKEEHRKKVCELESKIDEHNRKLEDATSARVIIEKKFHQKTRALQTEINKRRGIVVIHQDEGGTNLNSAELFFQSKELIGSIAKIQESNWELEERVAFASNSLKRLADEILRIKFGKPQQVKNDVYKEAHRVILNIAGLEREKDCMLRGDTN